MKALFSLRPRNPPLSKSSSKASKNLDKKANEKSWDSNKASAVPDPRPPAINTSANSTGSSSIRSPKEANKPKSPQEQTQAKISQFNKEAGNELFQNLFRKRASVIVTPADGFMLKQSRRGNWQTRWFSFRSPSLVYWKHEPKPDEPPDVVIDLRRVRRLSVDGLEMVLKFSSRVYNIKAMDAKQLKSWESTIRRTMQAGSKKRDKAPKSPSGGKEEKKEDTNIRRSILKVNKAIDSSDEEDGDSLIKDSKSFSHAQESAKRKFLNGTITADEYVKITNAHTAMINDAKLPAGGSGSSSGEKGAKKKQPPTSFKLFGGQKEAAPKPKEVTAPANIAPRKLQSAKEEMQSFLDDSEESDDTEVRKDVKASSKTATVAKQPAPAPVVKERSLKEQAASFLDSDTDEEGNDKPKMPPPTPAPVVKERSLKEQAASFLDSDTDEEENDKPKMPPPAPAPVVKAKSAKEQVASFLDSDTDEEENDKPKMPPPVPAPVVKAKSAKEQAASFLDSDTEEEENDKPKMPPPAPAPVVKAKSAKEQAASFLDSDTDEEDNKPAATVPKTSANATKTAVSSKEPTTRPPRGIAKAVTKAKVRPAPVSPRPISPTTGRPITSRQFTKSGELSDVSTQRRRSSTSNKQRPAPVSPRLGNTTGRSSGAGSNRTATNEPTQFARAKNAKELAASFLDSDTDEEENDKPKPKPTPTPVPPAPAAQKAKSAKEQAASFLDSDTDEDDNVKPALPSPPPPSVKATQGRTPEEQAASFLDSDSEEEDKPQPAAGNKFGPKHVLVPAGQPISVKKSAKEQAASFLDSDDSDEDKPAQTAPKANKFGPKHKLVPEMPEMSASTARISDESESESSEEEGEEDEGVAEDFLAGAEEVIPAATATRASTLGTFLEVVPQEFKEQSQLYLALGKVNGLRFNLLDINVRRAMLKSVKMRKYKVGEDIITQGDYGASFFIVTGPERDSEVVITVRKDDGTEKEITHLGVGCFFGERPLINPPGTNSFAARSATIRPFNSEVDVAEVVPDQFEHWQPFRISLILGEVPLLQKLPKDSREALQGKLKFARYQPGEYLFKEGDEGDRFYMVIRGEVQISDQGNGPDKPPRILVNLGEGHCFGEMSLVFASPRNASVQVVSKSPAEMAFLERDDFKAGMSGSEFMAIVNEITIEREVVREKREALNKARAEKEKERQDYSSTDGGYHDGEDDDDEDDGNPRRFGGRASSGSDTRRTRGKSLHISSSQLEDAGVVSVVKRRKDDAGQIFINNYKRVGKLGKGTYGEVFRVEDTNDPAGTQYALKVLDTKKSSGSTIQREIAVLKKLRHRNLVGLHEVLDDPSDSKVYLVMELVAKGELIGDIVQMPKPFEQGLAREYFRDVLTGLAYLHCHGVIHCDLKPQNLFVTADNRIKIADFGSATFDEVMDDEKDEEDEEDEDQRLQRRSNTTGNMGAQVQAAAAAAAAAAEEGNIAEQAALGTPLFMAPELFKCSSEFTDEMKFVQPSVDIWSLGATLYMMVCGRPPWLGRNELELSHRIQHVELTFPNAKDLDPHLRALLKKMLVKEAKDRIQLHEIFDSEWVTQEGIDPIELEEEDFMQATITKRDVSGATGEGSMMYGDEDDYEDEDDYSDDDDDDGIQDNDDEEEDGEEGGMNNDAMSIIVQQEMAELEALLKKHNSATAAEKLRIKDLISRHDEVNVRVAQARADGSMISPRGGGGGGGGSTSRSTPPSSFSSVESGGRNRSTSPARGRVGFDVASEEGSRSRKSTAANKKKSQRDRGSVEGGNRSKSPGPRQRSNTTGTNDRSPSRGRSPNGNSPYGSFNHGNGSRSFDKRATSPQPPKRQIRFQHDHSSSNEIDMKNVSEEFRDQAMGLIRKGANDKDKHYEKANYHEVTLVSSSSGSSDDPNIGIKKGSSFDEQRSLRKSTQNFTFMAATIEVIDSEDDVSGSGYSRDDSSNRTGTGKGSSGGGGSGTSSSSIDDTANSSVAAKFQTRGVLKLSQRDGISNLKGLPRGHSTKRNATSSSDNVSTDGSGKEGSSGGVGGGNLDHLMSDDEDDSDEDDYDISGKGGDDLGGLESIQEGTDDVMDFLDSVISKANPSSKKRGNSFNERDEDLTEGEEQYQPLPLAEDPWAKANKTRGASSHNLLAGTPIVFGDMHMSSGAVNAVQVRNFGDQRNLAATFLRFGAKADQGPCKYMEDRLVSWPNFNESPELPLSDIGVDDPTLTPGAKEASLAAAATAAGENSGDDGKKAKGFLGKVNKRASFGEGFVVPLAGAVVKAGSFFAVYDGHGGGEAADHLRDELHGELKRQLLHASDFPETFENATSMPSSPASLSSADYSDGGEVGGSDRGVIGAPASGEWGIVVEAFKRAFNLVDKSIVAKEIARIGLARKRNSLIATRSAGSTALAVMLFRAPTPDAGGSTTFGTDRTSKPKGTPLGSRLGVPLPAHAGCEGPLYLLAANVGDCRAILSRAGEVVELTFDHKVTSKRERERITRLGLDAQIRDNRLFGVLAVSRSFGDVALKTRQTKALQEESYASRSSTSEEAKEALIATPEVTRILIQPQDEFVVMGSDGIWDVLSSQKALNFVRKRLVAHRCAQRAAGELVAEAVAMGSHDNVSAIVVMLHQTG